MLNGPTNNIYPRGHSFYMDLIYKGHWSILSSEYVGYLSWHVADVSLFLIRINLVVSFNPVPEFE